MTSNGKLNGQVSLAALDFLGLGEQRRVAYVEVGRNQIVWVCDLSTEVQQKLFTANSKSNELMREAAWIAQGVGHHAVLIRAAATGCQ